MATSTRASSEVGDIKPGDQLVVQLSGADGSTSRFFRAPAASWVQQRIAS